MVLVSGSEKLKKIRIMLNSLRITLVLQKSHSFLDFHKTTLNRSHFHIFTRFPFFFSKHVKIATRSLFCFVSLDPKIWRDVSGVLLTL